MRSDSRKEEIVVLVKALPRPSRKYGETVCCAGVTREGEWRRLYPIRFRQLRDNQFARWQWLHYKWRSPVHDRRIESRTVLEDSLEPGDFLKQKARPELLEPIVVGSAAAAADRGQSLALIRPKEVRFRWIPKSMSEIEDERRAYEEASRQQSFLDPELRAIEPTPYDFRLSFRDENGKHDHGCADWETSAAFWRLRRRYGEEAALRHLNQMYNEEYPTKGMVLALGNMVARPQTWLLLGVIRLDKLDTGFLI